MKCNNCGSVNLDQAKFCRSCGNLINEPTTHTEKTKKNSNNTASVEANTVKLSFSELLKDSDQTHSSTIIWIAIHTIIWPLAAIWTGAFFIIITLIFLFRGKIDAKPSTIYAKVWTAIISILSGLILFSSSSNLSAASYYRYSVDISQGVYQVLSFAILITGLLSIISLWRDYKTEIEFREMRAERERRRKNIRT